MAALSAVQKSRLSRGLDAGTAYVAPNKVTKPTATPIPVAIQNNATALGAWQKMTPAQQQAFLTKNASGLATANSNYLKANPLASTTSTNTKIGGGVPVNTTVTDTTKFTTGGSNIKSGGGGVSDFNKFGKEAKLLAAKDPLFLDRRNDYIASDLSTKGKTTDQDILSFLNSQQGYKTATEQEKQNTFNELKNKVTQKAQSIEAETKTWDNVLDQIAKNQGFKSADDLKTKTGNDYTDMGKAYYNALASGDQSQIDAFNAMLGQQIAGNKDLLGYQGQEAGQKEAILSFYKANAPQVFQDKQTIDSLMSEGYNAGQIAGFLGKDAQYVTDITNNDISKYVSLTDQQQKELLKFNTAGQEKARMDEEAALRDRQIALERAQRDYQIAYDEQTKNNDIMSKNMSVLARMTGAGYSSLGLEGFDNVYQQGQKALQSLTNQFQDYTQDQQNAIKDITEGYTYNIKLYNMQADDLVKNAKNGFFNNFQTIKAKYGELSDATMDHMNTLATDYIKQVQQINQWRTENMQKQTDQLWQRAMDIQKLNLQQQQVDQSGWTKLSDENGNEYMYNVNTGETKGGAPSSYSNTPFSFETAPITNLGFRNGKATDYGIDYDGVKGQPIQAPKDGTVTSVSKLKDGSVQLIMKASDGNQIAFNHCDPKTLTDFKVGQTIKQGETACYLGNTGKVVPGPNGDGSHVDVQIKTPSGEHITGTAADAYLKGKETKANTQAISPTDIERFYKGVDGIGKGKLSQARYDQLAALADAGQLPASRDQKARAKQILAAISTLTEMPGKKTGLGFWGEAKGLIKGSPEWDFQNKLATVKGLFTLDNLGLMKGALSDKDIEVLTNASTSLKSGMSQTAFDNEVARLKSQLEGVVTGVKPTEDISTDTTKPSGGRVKIQ